MWLLTQKFWSRVCSRSSFQISILDVCYQFNNLVSITLYVLVSRRVNKKCLLKFLSEPLAEWELEALRKFLPLNMNMDNAPFRHQIQACLRHAMVRARDSSLAYLRTMNSQKDKSQAGLPPGMLHTLSKSYLLTVFVESVTNSFEKF